MTELNIEWRTKLGNKTDYGIGSIGVGGIVQYGHLPAYKKAGFRNVAVYDLNHETAVSIAAEFDIPKVYDDLDDLLADPEVEIVDIAVPPWVQLGIVEKVVAAGKHMLCQKPLADNYADAVKIVELAEAAGLKQAINHQMRWDAGIAASRNVIERGLLGTPTDAQIQVSVETPWHMWPWLAAAPRLEIMYHSVHYIDAIRSLFGNPEWITSRHAKYAEQGDVLGETKTITILDYANGLQAMVAVNHYNVHGENSAIFRFLGTEGTIEGTIGLMYNYPTGRPDTFSYHQKDMDTIPVVFDELWVPDAFVGPMATLMEAIETDGVPMSNTRDYLYTYQIVRAAYTSAHENRSVRLDEAG